MDQLISENATAFYYSLVGFALLLMSIRPALEGKAWFNIPVVYIAVGAVMAGLGLPQLSPVGSDLELKVLTHASELIVIISLAGAGLAIDGVGGWRRWLPSWTLLGVAMPLTIAAIAALGFYIGGLGLAAALLLGASLAPTDPVLARAVQVGGPGKKQDGVRVALTAEAGLNDGLAFPFVWLAIGIAAAGSLTDFNIVKWVSYDLLYRVVAGVVVGVVVGIGVTRVLFSRHGDAQNERENAFVFMLAATFLSYGLAEFVHGYGFLSVFICARTGRALSKETVAESYEKLAHQSADQMEAVLMAVLLLWFGAYVGGELWQQWTWGDLIISAIILLVVRPVIAFAALLPVKARAKDKWKIAFFGIRGMGTIFYIAYAASHASFEGIEAVWRIAGLTILLSVIMHGTLAQQAMRKVGMPAGAAKNAASKDTKKGSAT